MVPPWQEDEQVVAVSCWLTLSLEHFINIFEPLETIYIIKDLNFNFWGIT
jgi:hypothetical protein